MQRTPHRVFSLLWALRFGFLLYAMAHARSNPLMALTAALSFFPLEAVGILVDTGHRDQYSEIMTWVVRHLSKHQIPFRGWNLLIPMVALPDCYNVGWLFSYYTGAWWLGGAMGLMLFALLNAHWLRPDLEG